VPRPKLDVSKKKVDAVQLRLSLEERALFDALKADLAGKELRGVVVSDAAVFRWLFVTAAASRGLGPRSGKVNGSIPKPKAKR
jgi:hypothetical protein